MEAHLALQQRIRELERENDQLVEIKSMYESAMATDRQRIKELRAAAITPEMRERIGAHQKRLENPNTQLRQWTLAADQIFSDLLGEQG